MVGRVNLFKLLKKHFKTVYLTNLISLKVCMLPVGREHLSLLAVIITVILITFFSRQFKSLSDK